MSFLPPEEQNQNGPQGQTTANPGQVPPPTGTGGSVGAGASAPKAGTAPNSSTPTQFGSSASKLGDYLSANAPQITNEANNIAGNLNTGYQQIGTDINNAANQFGSSVNAGYTAPNQDVVNQATSNPTAFVGANPNNVGAFQAQYNDQYTGPTNYESTTPYSNIQNEVNTAVTDAGMLQTPAGLQNYLAGTQTNPTQASTTLDQLLLSGNPGAEQTVNNAAQQYTNLTPQFQQSVTNSDTLVPAAQQAAQQAQQYAQSQFNPAVQNFGNTLTTNAANAEAQRNAYNGSLNNFYSSAVPIEQQINQYAGGLPNGIGSSIQDYIGQILAQNNANENVNPINAANYSTPEQYAEAAAIQQLANNGATLPINQSTIGQAGTTDNQNLTPLPTLQNVLSQYTPEIRSSYAPTLQAAQQSPNNTGDVMLNQAINNYGDLGKYLSTVDPQDWANFAIFTNV